MKRNPKPRTMLMNYNFTSTSYEHHLNEMQNSALARLLPSKNKYCLHCTAYIYRLVDISFSQITSKKVLEIRLNHSSFGGLNHFATVVAVVACSCYTRFLL